jgi:hypothetical protein
MKLAVFFIITGTLAAQNQTASVDGKVSDSVTHQAVSRVRISIQKDGTREALQQPPRSLVTDAGGAFSFDGLEPGNYLLTITHQSYLQTRFGLNKRITVKAGYPTEEISVVLTPGAAISGHVFDEDGDPMDGCFVQVTRPKADQGQVVGRDSAGHLGEEGAYRLYDIPAGRYVVTAQCIKPAFQPRPLSSGPDPRPTRSYPAASLPELVEVAPGSERSGVDFHMKPASVSYIRVTMGGGNWRGRGNLWYQLTPVDAQSPQNFFNGGRPIDTNKPTFEIPQVFPGSYLLRVSSDAPVGLIGAVQRVDVGDRPLETRLEFHDAINLPGRIEFESQDGADHPPFSQIAVQVTSEFLLPVAAGLPDQVQADGSFTIHAAFPGPLSLSVSGGQAAFMKKAWLASSALTDGRFDLSSGAGGELRILLSTKMASVRGTAPAGAGIAVTPVERRRFEGTRYQLADANGQFKIEGLAPGKYRIGVQDPRLGSIADVGEKITLDEGQTLVMDLKSEPNQ